MWFRRNPSGRARLERGLVVPAVVLVAVMFTSWKGYAQVVDSVYVRYGEESVKIGMSNKALGKPNEAVREWDATMGKPVLKSTFNHGLSVYTLPEQGEQNDLIVRIRLNEADLTLSNGLHAGVSEQDVKRKLGKPGGVGEFKGERYVSYYYDDDSKNLAMILIFFVDQSGMVDSIELAAPIV